MEKYQIIYADPPWQYRNAKGTGVAENHYKTMSVEEICSLPVKKWTDKNMKEKMIFCTLTQVFMKQAEQRKQIFSSAWKLDVIIFRARMSCLAMRESFCHICRMSRRKR